MGSLGFMTYSTPSRISTVPCQDPARAAGALGNEIARMTTGMIGLLFGFDAWDIS
jgi:hypothetical protein